MAATQKFCECLKLVPGNINYGDDHTDGRWRGRKQI